MEVRETAPVAAGEEKRKQGKQRRMGGGVVD